MSDVGFLAGLAQLAMLTCLLRATLAVLDRVRCYIRGCWRESPRAKCRLSGQTPRTKGASEGKRDRNKTMDATKTEVAGAEEYSNDSNGQSV